MILANVLAFTGYLVSLLILTPFKPALSNFSISSIDFAPVTLYTRPCALSKLSKSILFDAMS